MHSINSLFSKISQERDPDKLFQASRAIFLIFFKNEKSSAHYLRLRGKILIGVPVKSKFSRSWLIKKRW